MAALLAARPLRGLPLETECTQAKKDKARCTVARPSYAARQFYSRSLGVSNESLVVRSPVYLRGLVNTLESNVLEFSKVSSRWH